VDNNETFTANDAQKIQQNFVSGTPFTRSAWTFWNHETPIVSNPLLPNTLPDYPSVSVPVGSDVNLDMYGLATGDFNMSFDPSSYKAASSTLDLIYTGNRQVSNNMEFDLPVNMVNGSQVGAISLILNFPEELVEVKDVMMNGTGGNLSWAVKGNELRIGWNTSVPINLNPGSELLILRLRTTSAFTIGNSIRITLAANPLNELADEMYNVIGDAVLSVDVIDATTVGTDEPPAPEVYKMAMSCYPNPFFNFTMITYTLPFEGKVTLEISSIVGHTVTTLVSETQNAGDHMVRFNTPGMESGVFTATLRLKSANDELIRTIKLIHNK
jgi:hypothetical protein